MLCLGKICRNLYLFPQIITKPVFCFATPPLKKQLTLDRLCEIMGLKPYQFNEQISMNRQSTVNVFSSTDKFIGKMTLGEAEGKAVKMNLDTVLRTESTEIPVIKLMNYRQEIVEKLIKKMGLEVEKEESRDYSAVSFGIKISENDLNLKMKKSEELLDASGAIRIGIRVNPKNSSDISRAKLLLNDFGQFLSDTGMLTIPPSLALAKRDLSAATTAYAKAQMETEVNERFMNNLLQNHKAFKILGKDIIEKEEEREEISELVEINDTDIYFMMIEMRRKGGYGDLDYEQIFMGDKFSIDNFLQQLNESRIMDGIPDPNQPSDPRQKENELLMEEFEKSEEKKKKLLRGEIMKDKEQFATDKLTGRAIRLLKEQHKLKSQVNIFAGIPGIEDYGEEELDGINLDLLEKSLDERDYASRKKLAFIREEIEIAKSRIIGKIFYQKAKQDPMIWYSGNVPEEDLEEKKEELQKKE